MTHVPPLDPKGWRGQGLKQRSEGASILAMAHRAQVPMIITAQMRGFEQTYVPILKSSTLAVEVSEAYVPTGSKCVSTRAVQRLRPATHVPSPQRIMVAHA